ncbi:hypothetical protein GCM10010359_13310 [Streptomyces morookaense]|nr:hypothetical protein GCM10010359_13310 [Streptomyces morookaense]
MEQDTAEQSGGRDEQGVAVGAAGEGELHRSITACRSRRSVHRTMQSGIVFCDEAGAVGVGDAGGEEREGKGAEP